MEQKSFRLTVDLSNFFNDYRSRVRIHIDEKIKAIQDIESKLSLLFKLNRFYLTCENVYLPPSEDVRVLQQNEVLCAVPIVIDTETIETNNVEKKSRKQKCIKQDFNGETHTDDNHINDSEPTYSTKKDKSERKTRKRQYLESRNESFTSIEEQHLYQNKMAHEILQKKTFTKNTPTNICDAKYEYKCKGDLPSYIKKNDVPTITHEYLNEKKINIVKIDIVKQTSQKCVENKNQSVAPKSFTDNPETYLLNNGNNLQVSNNEKTLSGTEKQSSTINIDETECIRKQRFFFSPSTMQNLATKLNTEKKIVSENQPNAPKYFKRRSPSMSPQLTTATPNAILSNPIKNVDETATPNAILSTPIKNVDVKETMDLSDISGLVSFSESSSIHKSISAISGIEELSLHQLPRIVPTQKEISGVGQLLEELKSQHSSPYTTTVESDCNEVFKKRKRKRVRKRKKERPGINISSETTFPESSTYSQIPMNSKGCPSLHIKYEYDNENEDNIKIVSVNEDTQDHEKEVNIVNLTSEHENWVKGSFPKTQSMKNILPKLGDVISFKILRITENYTPEISEIITGKVAELENNNIVFDIIIGLDQCQQPSGKFSVENDNFKSSKNSNRSNYISFTWENLIEPHLLFP